MYSNIDGISSKKDLFTLCVNREQPHVILITETKMSPDMQTGDYFKVSGYTCYRRDRIPSDGGGGVAIFIKDYLTSEDCTEEFGMHTETDVCKIIHGNRELLVSCIYRPPPIVCHSSI